MCGSQRWHRKQRHCQRGRNLKLGHLHPHDEQCVESETPLQHWRGLSAHARVWQVTHAANTALGHCCRTNTCRTTSSQNSQAFKCDADHLQHATVNQIYPVGGSPAQSYVPVDFDDDLMDDPIDWHPEQAAFDSSDNGQVGDTTARGYFARHTDSAIVPADGSWQQITTQVLACRRQL